jgi:hypothetical protein
VTGGVLRIDNFLETDPIVVRWVEATNDSVAEVHRLLVLGGHVRTVTGSASAAIALTEAVDRLTNNVEETVEGALEGITKTAKDLLDGQDGQLPKALDGFRKEFDAMLGSSFDPDSKKSILAKFEALLEAAAKDQSKLLNIALDPHAPDSLIGRLRAEVVKTVKDEAADIGKQLGELRELITSAAAAESASKEVFDLTSQKGFKFEDLLHELINRVAVHFGDVAAPVGTEPGLLGSKTGDEIVVINPEDTRGTALTVVWEAKTGKQGLRKILEELGHAMANRVACVGIAVFGSAEVAPVKVPFAQYGDKAILVLDKEHPDPGAVSLAYLWSRWVARRNLADSAASPDFGKIEALIAELTRSLQHLTEAKKFLTVGRKGIDDAGAHLEAMKQEIKLLLDDLKTEIDKAA